MQSIVGALTASGGPPGSGPKAGAGAGAASSLYHGDAARRRMTNRVLWLKLNFTVKAARLQSHKRQKYQHLQEEALLKARGLLQNWENGVVVLTEDLYRRAAGERDAQELMNYTPEALALRFSLRNDPHVLEAVKKLWQIEMTRDTMGCIDQRGYAGVFRRIAKSLDAKAFKKKQKVDRLLDDDWKRDSKGEPTMSFANFFDSIFELADLWCETIDASDYVAFLDRLCDCVSHVRHGKRTFKVMKKVSAMDGDSDDEEEEEEEEEIEEEEEAPPPQKLPSAPPAAAARLLVAKSILPAQQPKQQQERLQRTARNAAMTSKVVARKTTVISAVVPSVMPLRGTEDSTRSSSTPPSRNGRRASVVTTIEFLDVDGLAGNVQGADDGSTNRGFPISTSAAATAAMSAFSSSKRSQGGQLRPSLASVAAAALGRSDEEPVARSESIAALQPISEQSQVPHKNAAARLLSSNGGSKRITTVSTARRSVLQSIVFTTGGRTNSMANAQQAEQASEVESPSGYGSSSDVDSTPQKPAPVPTTTAAAGAAATSRTRGAHQTGGRVAASNGVAIRVRTNSLFDMDQQNTAPGSGGTGSVRTTLRGGPGRTRLRQPNSGGWPADDAMQVGSRIGNGGATALTAIVHTNNNSQWAGNNMTMASGSITPDFSGSVVMTSFAVERGNNAAMNNSLRSAAVLYSSAARTVPPPTGAQQHGLIVGTRAVAKPTTMPAMTEPLEQLPITEQDEPATKSPMVLLLNKPPPSPQRQPQQALAGKGDHLHRYGGQAHHATAGGGNTTVSSPFSNGETAPSGSPGRAIHVQSALDPERVDDRSSHSRSHPVAMHPHYYEYTDPLDPGDHGMNIQSLGGTRQPRQGMPQSHATSMFKKPAIAPVADPLASPWRTVDDDDDDGRVGRGSELLQSESAMEVLAKMRTKRATSLSAGSSQDNQRLQQAMNSSSKRPGKPRRTRTSTPSSSTDPHTRPDDFDSDSGSEMESSFQWMPPRGRILTVSSLGGSTVDSGYSSELAAGRLTNIPWRNDGDDDALAENYGSMTSSVSLPTLHPASQLELDYTQSSFSSGSRRNQPLVSQSSPLPGRIPVGIRRQRFEDRDDFELRGELAMAMPTMDPTRSSSPPRSRASPVRAARECTCSRRHEPELLDGEPWPSPVYHLDQRQEVDGRDDASPSDSPGGRCAVCRHHTRDSEVTVTVNATREVVLTPTAKEQDVQEETNRKLPRRSEMMRRRHRYTRGKPISRNVP